MGSRDLVNKFTAGELDPRFIAEVDFDGYRKAGRRLRNVVSIPQGGVQKRFGTVFDTVITNNGVYVSNIDQVRLISYEFIDEVVYDIIIRPDSSVPFKPVAFDIYQSTTLLATVLCDIGTYNASDIRNIRWVKNYDTIILLLDTVRPYILRRVNHTTWTLSPMPFQFFPTWDFTAQDNPQTLPTPGVPYTSSTVTFTPNAANATTITANTAVFTSNHVNGLYFGNGATFRITAVNVSGTVATGYCLVEFPDTSAVKGELSSLLERAWNDGNPIGGAPQGTTRLWPTHGCIYQSRLVLGGSPSLPSVAFGSNTKAYNDFDDSFNEPSYTFDIEISVTGTDVIQDIISTKSIVILGNKGPGSTTILLNEPTTPTNAFVNTQDTMGSRNMNGIIIDNQILYADKAGNTIWAMSYDIPDTGYTINNASILSPHLIRGPRWADIFDPDDVDGRYYMLVNSDGTLAVFNTLRDENIRAWTLATTTGSFIDVQCASNQCKFLVRRKISTAGFAIDGNPDAFYTVDEEFMSFNDELFSIEAETGLPVFLADKDYILIGSEIPFTQIQILLDVTANVGILASYQFLNNTGVWETFNPIADGTADFTSSGAIEWLQEDVSNWSAQTIDLTTKTFNELAKLYWVRIRRNNDNPITSPVIHTVFVDTQDVIYLEHASFEVYMDSQMFAVSDAAGDVSLLGHVAGQNVFVFVNNFPIGTYYVPSSGVLNIPYPFAFVTVGIETPPEVITMPLVAVLQNGYSVYEPAHVKQAYVDYYQSAGLMFDTQSFPQVEPGVFMSQEVPQLATGFYKFATFGGWDPRKPMLITQSYPAPMTILGVSYTIEVNP